MTLKEWFAEDGSRTQGQLATLTGLDQGHISRLVGGATCSADTMRVIHEATGGAVTPNDMVLGRAA